MMDLHLLPSCEYPALLDDLCHTVEQLIAVIDELAFTRAQELSIASLSWNGVGEDSIQKKDRAAKYSSAGITEQIYRLEGQRDALIERKFFTIRLLDDHRQGLR